MIKIDDGIGAGVDLDDLALQHYHSLVGELLNDGINYHAVSSLVQRIRNRRTIDEAIPEPIRVAFWDYLLDADFLNLRRIVTGRPNELKLIINEINGICGAGFFSSNVNYNSANLTAFGSTVKEIFNYRLYRNRPECHDNCSLFRLSFCPYCNLGETQVITIIDDLTADASNKALLQLDHFYPQSRHPYFGVSFFNLVPGCANCNAVLKLDKDFDIESHFNPFEKRFDDYFSFQLDSFLMERQEDVRIIYTNKQPFSDDALNDFRIIERYENIANKRMIFRLVNALRNHSPKIRQSIGVQFMNLFNGESKKDTLLYNQNIPKTRNEINVVQLGKLKRDISIQLGVLEE